MANIANIIGKLTSINTSLGEIKNAIVGGSSTDYDNLTNKPQINSVTLSGNKTPGDLGLVASSSVGVASGVAELDNSGHVPSSQLPSYVDDVVEGYYNNVTDKFYSDNAYTTEIPGETGKIYITLDTNLSYRYTGSGFTVVSPSLALGETSSTAYRGDRGKIAYDTSQSNSTAIGNINTALGNTSISGVGDGTVTGAISTLNNSMELTSSTILVDSSIAVSGNTNWQTKSGSFASGYKIYLIKIGSHGTIQQSIIISAKELTALYNIGSGYMPQISSYWDSGNLGSITINYYTFSINAKTQTYALDYIIVGMN